MKCKSFFHLVFFFNFVIINFSCESPKQGCNDPSATNFAFDADEPCDANLSNNNTSCPCIFPSLIFKFIPQFVISKNNKDSNIIWKSDLLISNKNNQSFYLRGFCFFISNITFEDASGKKTSTIDSISIPVKYNTQDSASVKIQKNIALFGQNTSSVSIGTFKEYGSFKTLTFDIGLQAPSLNANILNRTMPSYFLNTDSMYVANNFSLIGAKFLLQLNSPNSKTIEYSLVKTKKISLQIPNDISFKIAQNAELQLNFDYNALFSTIDLGWDKEVIESKILENLASSLSISK